MFTYFYEITITYGGANRAHNKPNFKTDSDSLPPSTEPNIYLYSIK